MITREEAVRAKEGMEHYKSPEMQLRVRSVIYFILVFLQTVHPTDFHRLAGA